MPGAAVLRLLADAPKLIGIGSYPAVFGLTAGGSTWTTLQGRVVEPMQLYTVASTDFYVETGDTMTGYLTTAAGNGVTLVGRAGDSRAAFIAHLKYVFP